MVALDKLPPNLGWVLLENIELINYSELKQCAEYLCPEIADSDDLFDEVCGLQRVIPEITMSSFESLCLDQRWAIITKDSFLSIRKLVATIFAIPASNASCERVFSLSKVQWSDERNRLDVTTICSILKVFQNFNLSCLF